MVDINTNGVNNGEVVNNEVNNNNIKGEIEMGVNNNKVQYVVVNSKQEIVEFLRDEEIRAFRIKSETELSEAHFLERVSEDRRSPRLLDVLYNQVYEDEIFWAVEDLEFDDVVEVIVKSFYDGVVYYKQSVECVTVYELGELTGEIGTVPSMDVDELYVPYPYDLEEAYDSYSIFKDVLNVVNQESKHFYDVYTDLLIDVLDSELYGYVERYCRGYYGM